MTHLNATGFHILAVVVHSAGRLAKLSDVVLISGWASKVYLETNQSCSSGCHGYQAWIYVFPLGKAYFRLTAITINAQKGTMSGRRE